MHADPNTCDEGTVNGVYENLACIVVVAMLDISAEYRWILSLSLTFLSSTLFALAKQSKNLGAYKMARTAYDKLQVCI